MSCLPPEATAGVVTALDLPVDDTDTHFIGACRLVTAQHTDCGLIWVDYPEAAEPRTRKQKARKRKSKRNTLSEETLHSAEMAPDLVEQLQELGLPAAFGTSKGEAYENEEETTIASEAEMSGAGQPNSLADQHVHNAQDEADQSVDLQVRDDASQWQQAYDETYSCFYYYRESTQETQWEAPEEGFLPAPPEWLEYACQQAIMAQDASLQQQTMAQDASLQQQTTHAMQATQTASPSTSSQDITHPQAAAGLGHATIEHSSVSDADCSDSLLAAGELGHGFNPQALARPESSGLMASIPTPAGTHIRFADSDEESGDATPQRQTPEHDPQQDTAAQDISEALSSVSLQQPANSKQSSDILVPDKHSLVQAAVKGMLASTVVPSETPEPTEPLNDMASLATPQTSSHAHNMPATSTSALSHTELDVSPTTESVAAESSRIPADGEALPNELADKLPGNLTAFQHGGLEGKNQDNEYSMGVQGDVAEASGVGITYASLGGALQSKKALPRRLWKYWLQRYSLFSRFDEGILMDEEGWYSATPEVIAAHHARTCRCSVVVDAFAGVGGNAIQFALTCDRVIAVDLCAQRLQIARHNAEVYGVADKIQFVQGDFLELAATFQADVVFLSPPWGGPAYSQSSNFDVSKEIGSLQQNMSQLLQTASAALKELSAQAVACFLPRNTDLHVLSRTQQSQRQYCVERNVLNGHLKAVTVYYGNLATIDP